MSDLLPCPFCGDQAWLHTARVFEGSHGYRVECEGRCHAMTCYWHTEDEAKQHWNTRADNTVIRELAEALKDLRELAFESVELDSWPELQKCLHESGKTITKHAKRIKKCSES